MLLRGYGQWYRCGRDWVAHPTGQENLDPQPQRHRRRQEDVSKGEPSRGQTGLHSRSSDLTSELQSSVRSDEVVVATEQLQVLIKPLRRASVGKCSSRKVCRALPDRQIQPLDERRVPCRRVLGVVERVCESPRGSVQRSAFDLDDAIVPARLEDLAVETRWTEEATDDLLVEFGSIRDDQGKTPETHPPRKVAKQSVSVPVASPSRHPRWPEPRPDLDRNEDPTRRLLVARERANLVGLKLFGSEASDPSVVESMTHLGCFLEPAGDGVPGNPFDPGNRGNADTLDSESDDHIESSSSMLETGKAFPLRSSRARGAPSKSQSRESLPRLSCCRQNRGPPHAKRPVARFSETGG